MCALRRELRSSVLVMAFMSALPPVTFADDLSAAGSIPAENARVAEQPTAEDAAAEFSMTHKQARTIRPMHLGQPIRLNTYSVDRDGNLLVCVGGDHVAYVRNDDGTTQSKTIESPKLLQVYSPDGELLRSTELSFQPTAVNQAPNGTIFVAGSGKIARISGEGELQSTVDSPHVGDLESFRERIQEASKAQAEQSATIIRQQLTRTEERIAELKGKPEADLTDRDRKRLETMQQQRELYEQQLQATTQALQDNSDPGDQMVARKLGITALAVTSRDLFVCCNAIQGYGYEVWRMTHEFSEPVRVVDELRGCCGQCDIQATETHLVLAENTKFKVALLDRDGKRLFDFGKGDRKAVDGFGSCCNPMNVRCCDNGDILTAESSIGTIKRFSSDGQLLGVVGKAKIGGGCKHVALGCDAARNRYYMMNVDKSHICVLVPNAEAPEITPDEVLARTAREGLGQKLIGEWSLNGLRPGDRTSKRSGSSSENGSSLFRLAAAALLGDSGADESAGPSDPYSSSYIQFCADGRLKLTGGMFARQENAWEAVSQEGNTLLVSQIQDQIQYYTYKIEFVSDDEATISLMYNDQVLSSNRFQRVKPPAESAAAVSDAAIDPNSVPAPSDSPADQEKGSPQ